MGTEPEVGQIWKKLNLPSGRFIRIESWIGDAFRVADVELHDGEWKPLCRKHGSPFIPPKSLLQRFTFHASE